MGKLCWCHEPWIHFNETITKAKNQARLFLNKIAIYSFETRKSKNCLWWIDGRDICETECRHKLTKLMIIYFYWWRIDPIPKIRRSIPLIRSSRNKLPFRDHKFGSCVWHSPWSVTLALCRLSQDRGFAHIKHALYPSLWSHWIKITFVWNWILYIWFWFAFRNPP